MSRGVIVILHERTIEKKKKNNKILLTKLSSKIYSIIYRFILSKGLEKNYVKLIILK